jgi:hypothetical protein
VSSWIILVKKANWFQYKFWRDLVGIK